jgi:hypothetical protein
MTTVMTILTITDIPMTINIETECTLCFPKA